MKNICVEPKISHLLTSIELEYERKVWICMSAKINTATIESRYKFYRTCNDINVVRSASHSITSCSQKSDMIVNQANTNFTVKNISVMPENFLLFDTHRTLF